MTGSADNPAAPTYSLGIGVTFRKNGTHFETYGSCGSISRADGKAASEGANCGVDCDGGSISVTLKNPGSVLVAIPEGARLSEVGSGESEEPENAGKRFGADDKLFRLDRTRLADCLSLAADDDEKAEIRRGR